MQPERPNRIPWPPIIYASAALAGLLLHWQWPLPWPFQFEPLRWPGFAFMAFAVGFEAWATLHFLRHRTTILPNRGATRLITSGPFAWSRNPIYLGNTLLLAGFGLAFRVWWLVIMAPVAAIFTLRLAIIREETHLSHRFGLAWDAYAANTRRWFGRKF